MTFSLESFGLGSHLLSFTDLLCDRDYVDVDIWKVGSVILSKSPSTDSEVKESLQCLVQGKHRGSRNAQESAPRYHAAPET